MYYNLPNVVDPIPNPAKQIGEGAQYQGAVTSTIGHPVSTLRRISNSSRIQTDSCRQTPFLSYSPFEQLQCLNTYINMQHFVDKETLPPFVVQTLSLLYGPPLSLHFILDFNKHVYNLIYTLCTSSTQPRPTFPRSRPPSHNLPTTSTYFIRPSNNFDILRDPSLQSLLCLHNHSAAVTFVEPLDFDLDTFLRPRPRRRPIT